MLTENKNKIIILGAVIFVLLGVLVAGYFLWFKGKAVDLNNNQEVDKKALESKFNLDIFKDASFQELKESPVFNTSTSENLGQENPFLEF